MLHQTLFGRLSELVLQVRSLDAALHRTANTQGARLVASQLLDSMGHAKLLAHRLIQLRAWATEADDRQGYGEPRFNSLEEPPELARAADFAFVMRIDLMTTERELLETMTGPPDELLSECKHVQRGLLSALDALASCIAQGQPPRPTDGLTAALAVRRACARLRAEFAKLAPVGPLPASVVSGLRAAGSLIATLVRSDAYPYFRSADRQHVAALQRRILAFLNSPKPASMGLRLLDDCKALSELLALVNQRQELRNHDQEQLSKWLTDLDSTHLETPAELLTHYRPRLYGLDDDLDAVFDGRITLDRHALLGIVGKLACGAEILPDDVPTSPTTEPLDPLVHIPESHGAQHWGRAES